MPGCKFPKKEEIPGSIKAQGVALGRVRLEWVKVEIIGAEDVKKRVLNGDVFF